MGHRALAGEHGDVVPAAATVGDAAQKKTLHASERDTEQARQARIDYCAQLNLCPAERLKFVDEAGINIAMTRRFGRAPKGRRVHDAVPKNWGKNVTLLGALSCHGLEAVMTVEGATDAAVFRAFVSDVLAPTLQPGDIVVMDNLGAHKVDGIATAIQARGASLVYCHRIRPTTRPSNLAGPNSKPICVRPKRARARRWIKRWPVPLIW